MERPLSASYSAAAAAFIDPVPAPRGLADRPVFAALPGLPLASPDVTTVLLRNVGGKPLRVRAELLAEGRSRDGDQAMWHEVAIYRTDVGQIAVALRFMRRGADVGIHRARLFDGLDAAATWLEQFDPSADLSADFDVSDNRLSAASVALKAASLRERAERLDRAYRGLVGEILFLLESEP